MITKLRIANLEFRIAPVRKSAIPDPRSAISWYLTLFALHSSLFAQSSNNPPLQPPASLSFAVQYAAAGYTNLAGATLAAPASWTNTLAPGGAITNAVRSGATVTVGPPVIMKCAGYFVLGCNVGLSPLPTNPVSLTLTKSTTLNAPTTDLATQTVRYPATMFWWDFAATNPQAFYQVRINQ
jgi:hypothetical protein